MKAREQPIFLIDLFLFNQICLNLATKLLWPASICLILLQPAMESDTRKNMVMNAIGMIAMNLSMLTIHHRLSTPSTSNQDIIGCAAAEAGLVRVIQPAGPIAPMANHELFTEYRLPIDHGGRDYSHWTPLKK